MVNLRDNKIKSIPAGNHMPRSNDPCRNAFTLCLILITISAVFFHSVKISERQMKNIFFHTGKVDLMFDQILINSGIINTSL